MGSLRFVLALLVLISHLGVSIAGRNPGVVAVIVFYLLAGYVVAQLWQRWQDQPRACQRFYADRCWRILPQYLAALVLALLAWRLGAQSPFLSRSPGFVDLAANFSILPLNYYMYTGQDAFTLIPPAWSLAAELQFYLLAPLLLMLPASRILLVFGASLLIFLLAQARILDLDHLGYRLLPGMLFIFLAGVLIRQQAQRASIRALLGSLWCCLLIYLAWLLAAGAQAPYNIEVALGLLIGLPLVAGLAHHSPVGRLKTINSRLGILSYGIFLYHFPVIWLLQLAPSIHGVQQVFAVVIISILTALLGHLIIEKPLWRWYRFSK